MRPHTAIIKDRVDRHFSSKAERSKTLSGSRSPMRSNRKTKRDKSNLDSKSDYLMTHNYSNDLSKTTSNLSVYNKQIESLMLEKMTMQDLISRMKLEIKHAKYGAMESSSSTKRYSVGNKSGK